MICSLAYVWFAMSLPRVSISQHELPTRPAVAISRAQTGEVGRRPTRGDAARRAEDASCRKFVAGFYVWYVARGKHGDPLRVALRRKRANFSSQVIRRLHDDARAAARSPGEIVGLDFDPVLNSQDFAERYVPGSVRRRGGRFFVDVYAVEAGKQSKRATVVPELRRQNGRWVFTNFHYNADGKPDDLLSLLRQLRAGRKQSK